MRVRYSFSSRKAGHIEKIHKQKKKYPKIVQQLINSSDIILEVLDARFIEETRNKEVEKLILSQKKTIIFLLNKIDLIDRRKISEETLLKLYPYVFISAKSKKGIKNLRQRIKREADKVSQPTDQSTNKISIGVIGYPNTGKSSIINLLAGRHAAGTGSDAGFTKGIQKIRLSEDIRLIDTPGVIPQSAYSEIEKRKIAQQTKLGGRSFSQVKDPEDTVAYLMKEYPKALEKYYQINAKKDAEKLIEELGKQKGFLKKGGIVNEDKTSRQIIKDWQQGKIKV